MLDISVGRGTSFDLARRLRAAGTPYIFASGYGDQAVLDSDHSASVIIPKPYERDHLRCAIHQVMRDRRLSSDAGVNYLFAATKPDV